MFFFVPLLIADVSPIQRAALTNPGFTFMRPVLLVLLWPVGHVGSRRCVFTYRKADLLDARLDPYR
jgi:hypothetical protein